MTILLIEPDRLMAANIIKIFKRRGHRTDWSPTAQAGLYAADKRIPDVLKLQAQLALHGGVEFMHEFRSYPEWEAIPAVLFSSALLKDIEIWRGLGISQIFYKPATSLRTLVDAVEQLPQAASL